MAKKLIDKSIPRFLMVGVLNTLVGAGVIIPLVQMQYGVNMQIIPT